MKHLILILVALSLSAEPAQFEVASVKVSVSGVNGVRGGCHGVDSAYGPNEQFVPPLGRCVITDGRLSHLIGIAYGFPMAEIKNAPDWVIAGAERFNIEAKVEDPTKVTKDQLLQMLRSLLEDRFKLKFHVQTKEVPGFALVIRKNEAQLKESKSEDSSLSLGSKSKEGPMSLTARKYSMQSLAALLSQAGPGPMVDKTGLTGAYDFTLAWNETTGPSLVTALQELGLRLEPQKVPVSSFVFESAQRPAAN